MRVLCKTVPPLRKIYEYVPLWQAEVKNGLDHHGRNLNRTRNCDHVNRLPNLNLNININMLQPPACSSDLCFGAGR